MKKNTILSILLILITPWCVQLGLLLVNGWWQWGTWNPAHILTNLSEYLSVDFLFLHGDINKRFSPREVGLFQLSMLPLFLVGLKTMAAYTKRRAQAHRDLLVWWFFIGVIIASFFGEHASFCQALLFTVPIQIVLVVGARKIFDAWRIGIPVKRLFIAAIGIWMIYEAIIFWHIFLVHYLS